MAQPPAAGPAAGDRAAAPVMQPGAPDADRAEDNTEDARPSVAVLARAARARMSVAYAHVAMRLGLLVRFTSAGVTCLLALAPVPAAASSRDVASAGAYIRANLALVQAARIHLRAGEAAPLKVLARVRRECPAAAAQSPQDAESTQMTHEVIGAMVLSAYHLDVPAVEAFVRRTARLRWGDARLARAVRGYAANLRVLARLAPPPLCADVKAWVAGGYRGLPASTVAFDRRFMSAWVAIGMLPARLSAYETAAERGAIARAEAIEVQITDAEARAVETWGKIMNELGLEP
jgi:hypothetical protein